MLKNRATKNALAVCIIAVLFAGIAFVMSQPITFRGPSLSKELTPKVITINGNHTDSFLYDRENMPLTIVIEVTYNRWKPVEGAGVTVYGYGGADTDKTDKDGLATLHLGFLTNQFDLKTGYGYLSMKVWKNSQFIIGL